MDIRTITEIQTEEKAEMRLHGVPPLDPENQAIAAEKRKSFDLPTNAVKVDPLR